MKETNLTYIQREELIARIVTKSVGGATPDEALFIQSEIGSVPSARFFVWHAKDLSWLYWLDEQRLLDPLFDVHHSLSPVEDLLAGWIANGFVIGHHRDVLELIAKHSQHLSPDFWRRIVWRITSSKDRPHGAVLASWIVVLIPSHPHGSSGENSLEYLLKECGWPEDKHAVLMLLSHLFCPVPTAQPSWSYLMKKDGYKFEFLIEVRGDQYWLGEIWPEMRKNMADLWRPLLPTVQKYLTDAHTMNLAFGRANEFGDPESFWRSAIEVHEQDANSHRSFNVLIDSARDIMEYLLLTQSLETEGKYLVDSWYATEVPLLRRIALHGLRMGSCWTADEKIEWLLGKQLLNPLHFTHEVFLLIKEALPGCSEGVVRRLVGAAVDERLVGADEDVDSRIRAHEKYKLLKWMQDASPGSRPIDTALGEVIAEHPDFRQSEHPDLGMWMGDTEVIEPKSPISTEDLMSLSFEEAAKTLLVVGDTEKDRWYDVREGLMRVLETSVLQSFDWSLNLATYLAESNQFRGDVWYHILIGWGKGGLTAERWDAIMPILIRHPEIHRQTGGACELLETTVRGQKAVTPELLSKLETLSDLIWSQLVDLPDEKYGGYGWLSSAINHRSGKLTEFWIQSLDRRRKELVSEWNGLPAGYVVRFGDVISSPAYAAQLSRCVLASRLHFLAFLDLKWTKEHMLPLFDFGSDSLTATQVWHGFLVWGHIPSKLREEMKPMFREAARRLEDTERIRERLFGLILAMAVNNPSTPADLDWLYSILGDKSTLEKDREVIADDIWRSLREGDEEFANSIWSRWLKQLWEDRIKGRPIELTSKEADRIVECTAKLVPMFSEAVALACEIENLVLRYTHLYSDLLKGSLVKSHPHDVKRLLIHILRKQDNYTHQQTELVPLYRVLKVELGGEQILDLTEELVRLGCISALEEFAEDIDDGPSLEPA